MASVYRRFFAGVVVRIWDTLLNIHLGGEEIMPLDSQSGGGSGDSGPFCTRCNLPIGEEPSQRLYFQQDPHGHQGLTGPYHVRCAKPFAAFERILNMNPWARF
jgi:hypothetical protein